jgi:GDPmannose 4,6-dehydratase
MFIDWGWAPEYDEAMWRMLQLEIPEDFVIATGETNSLREFISAAFAVLGLNWERHTESQAQLFRPSDISIVQSCPLKAQDKLGWVAKYKMGDVVRMMVEAENSVKN